MAPVLRIGMVGYGFMGKTHTHAYRSLGYYYDQVPAEVEFVGVATRTEASWRRAVERDGYRFGTTDYRELCNHADVDVIHVCTPNDSHRDVVLAALEAGKHVYVDKPLATSLAEAREMAAAAAARPDVVTQMTFQNRFIPALQRAKLLVDSDALGDLYSVRAAYLHAGYVDPNRPASWRLDARRSGPGGALFDLGSHVIDLTRWLFGEFRQVQHLGETFIKERPLPDDPSKKAPVEVDDISLLTFRLSSGAIGTLESSRLATGSQDELRVEAHGSKGALRFNLQQPNFLEFYDQTDGSGLYGGNRGFKSIESVQRYPRPARYPGPKTTIGWERFHIASIHHFAGHVATGTRARPDISDGAAVQAVLEAAVQSQRNGGAWTDVEDV